MGTKTDALLADEAAITEIDELKPLIAEGQERGILTVEQIAQQLHVLGRVVHDEDALRHYFFAPSTRRFTVSTNSFRLTGLPTKASKPAAVMALRSVGVTDAVSATITVFGGAWSVPIDPAGQYAYVISPGDLLTKIDIATDTVTGRAPVAIQPRSRARRMASIRTDSVAAS